MLNVWIRKDRLQDSIQIVFCKMVKGTAQINDNILSLFIFDSDHRIRGVGHLVQAIKVRFEIGLIGRHTVCVRGQEKLNDIYPAWRLHERSRRNLLSQRCDRFEVIDGLIDRHGLHCTFNRGQ
jgi:hypothetical protein